MLLFLAENVGVPLLAIAAMIVGGFLLVGVGNGLIRYATTDRRGR